MSCKQIYFCFFSAVMGRLIMLTKHVITKFLSLMNIRYLFLCLQGLKSSADEKGSSALHAMKLDDALGGRAVQVRHTSLIIGGLGSFVHFAF